ncbi:MAG: CBS domain-containing protein [Gemmatimonadota bacterium]
MKVHELMTKNPVCCAPSDSVQDAARLMAANEVGSLPVVDGNESGRPLGIVTDRDLAIGALAEGRIDARVSDVMTPNPFTVRDSDDVGEVNRIMSEEQVRRVPVVNDKGKVVGIVAQADLALSQGGVSVSEVGRVVERISEPEGASGKS